MLKLRVVVLAGLSCAGVVVAAQTAVPVKKVESSSFDVVSVKKSDPASRTMQFELQTDHVQMKGVPLKFTLQAAFGVHDFQIVGAPDWVGTERFDIDAKMDAPETPVEKGTAAKPDDDIDEKLLEQRMQALLAERFKLQVHRETKELPVYALQVEKSGIKMHVSTSNSNAFSIGPGMLKSTDMPMTELVNLLANPVDRVVLDETGLTSSYQIELKWNPDEMHPNDSGLPGLFTALQEQLGLRLVSKKGPVQVVVVDRMERPSDN